MLKVGPYALLLALLPLPARMGRFVFPKMTAPASRRRWTTGASWEGTRETPPSTGEVTGQAPVVGNPARLRVSLITIGTPSRARGFLCSARRLSEAFASLIASGFIWVNAL